MSKKLRRPNKKEEKYEYVVVYRLTPAALSRNRGWKIKQTLSGAQALAKWATDRGYDVQLRRRSVGPWEDV